MPSMKSQETINALTEQHFNEIKETLSQILEQTKKTNGRVTQLERDRASDRAYAYGALAVITTIVLPVALIVLKTWLD